jgi:hypothetical protein
MTNTDRRSLPWSRVGREHVVQLGDFQLLIADERIVHFGALGLLDVNRPAPVVVDGVRAEADHFRVASVEFRFQTGHVAQLRRADGREVLGMRKQNRPFLADPFVKLDGTVGGVGGEVGGFIADS